jgi:hypothetical protein
MRYVTIARPRAEYLDDAPQFNGQTVIVEDDQPVKTGLLDASGVDIYRVRERAQVGFIR